jgi:phage-related protein
MESVRTIICYGNFFYEFYDQQSEKVKTKIDYVLFVITVANRIPKQYFRHVVDTNGLYEIRVENQGNIFRIFCCFDEGKIVVLFNGFQKKSQKIPARILEKPISIMNEYFKEKRSTN